MSIPVDTDFELQTDVQDELAWSPEVDEAGIGVAVEDGTVTLSGEVDSMAERLAANRAAERVRGVRTVVDDLRVKGESAAGVSTTDIAREVDHALRWASNVPATVQAEVAGHQVTLTGEVEWDYQRSAARRAVQYLRGVHHVEDRLTLKTRPSAHEAEDRIKRALLRNAQLDADTIEATVAGTKVTLTGTVRSWVEKQQAAEAVWRSPHVLEVDNRIVVRPW